MIPYGRQSINEEDISAVVEVLRSDYLTQGPLVPQFENILATYCNAGHSVVFNSATSALHAACLALGVSAGDRVWTSPNTFVASANCAMYCGADIDFVDIDMRTYNMCADKLEEKLKSAQVTGTLPKVVIPVHFAGQSCDMERIGQLAMKYDFRIIEDASHAIGSSFSGEKVGSCTYSDITVFSFHPVKIITTGEGGAALTMDRDLSDRLALFRSHAVTRNPDQMLGDSHGAWYYEQIDLGFNYRMTEMQAALGISQMSRIDRFVTTRKAYKERYDDLLAAQSVSIPYQDARSESSFHLYPLLLNKESTVKDRKYIFDNLRAAGVGVNVHYIPVHLQPYYANMGFSRGCCPVAEDYYDREISLPLHQSMSSEDQDYVVNTLKRYL